MQEENLLTCPQLARKLGVSLGTIYNMLRKGQIKTVQNPVSKRHTIHIDHLPPNLQEALKTLNQ